MIDTTKNFLKKCFRSMPWGVKEAFFEAYVSDRDPFEILSRMAQQCRLRSVKVDGECGLIEGSPHDLAILSSYASEGRWAERTNRLIAEFFAGKESGTFLDIGGNIGLTTIPIAQQAQITCHAFEPEPANFAYLTENVRVNCPHANVTLHNIALFDRPSSLEMELSPYNFGDHRLRVDSAVSLLGEDKRQTVSIKALPLDDAVPAVSRPLAVKVDTQGAEPFVVSGGARILGQADLVLMEFSPYLMRRMGGDARLVIEFFGGFSKIELTRGEGDTVNETLTGADVVERLTAFERDSRDTPVGAYWDIVAWR